jgi:hypothetical protein
VIERYEPWLLGNDALMAALSELRGKVLGCWCAPRACHGDVLMRLANAPRRTSALDRRSGSRRAASRSRGTSPS